MNKKKSIEMTGALNSQRLVFRQISLTLQMSLSFDIAVVVCAARDKMHALDPSSVIMEPRYFNWPTVSSTCHLTLILAVICLPRSISFVF